MKPRHTADPALQDEAEHQLYEAILALRTVDEVKAFFTDLCTPAERQAMADRWRVIDPISQGIPYRTIAEQTGVSVTTIGRVARCLAMGTGGYRLIVDRISKEEK